MLEYILSDIYGNQTALKQPLNVSFVSSYDAPADSLTAVFAVDGTIPPLSAVEVKNDGQRIFYGIVDMQTDELTSKGVLLTVSARSLSAVLLDNEALPQTYSMVSMPLLMKRHFSNLGFENYIGSDKAFYGKLVISKGISEWEVLSEFCRKFLGTVPRIDCFGVIDISGENNDVLSVSSKQCISKKHILRGYLLISDIMTRAVSDDGYIMPFEDKFAKSLNVRKLRYVNAVDNADKSVLTAEKITKNADNRYEQLAVEYSGCILGSIGAKLIIDGRDNNYIIKEIHYSLNSQGEKTRIYAEVKHN